MITVPHVWVLATKPLKMILSLSLAESNFSQKCSQRGNTHLGFNHCIWGHRAPSNEAQPTLHRQNHLQIEHSSHLLCTWFSSPQIPPVWRTVLRPQQFFPYSCSFAEAPSNTNMPGICICSYSSSKLIVYTNARGKKCNIVSPVSKITTYCLCTLLLLPFILFADSCCAGDALQPPEPLKQSGDSLVVL